MYGMSTVSDVVVWVGCGSVGLRVLSPYYNTNIHAPGRIRTRNPSKGVAKDLRLSP